MENSTNSQAIVRCPWSPGNALLTAYHDQEWGTPVHDDRLLFEHLSLDGFQAGLSWNIILNKREAFRRGFNDFDPHCIIHYDDHKIESLMKDSGIVRNRRKIEAVISNARAFMQVQIEFDSFDHYIWQFTHGQIIHNHWMNMQQVPAVTPQAEMMSRDLKKRGFHFVGPTICYAFMQAVGMVNDHLVTCFRHAELGGC